jgi:hypothetical protein
MNRSSFAESGPENFTNAVKLLYSMGYRIARTRSTTTKGVVICEVVDRDTGEPRGERLVQYQPVAQRYTVSRI